MMSKVEDSINVETFELSPLNQSVITTKGRLRRSFPGPALSLRIDTFEKPEFQALLAQTLAKMSHQQAVGTRPKARKAGRIHDEDRDTIHPKIVTELFMGFLRSIGEPVDVTRLWKNTREEVMWLGTRLPWRRSAMWLLIRVAIQLGFSRSTGSLKSSGDLYKKFMVFLMSHILNLSHRHSLPSDLLYAMNAKVARRLMKLHPSVNRSELNFVESAMQNTHKVIQARWLNIIGQPEHCYNLSRIKCLDFGQDVFSSLPALDEYIMSLATREKKRGSIEFQPTPLLVKYQAEVLPAHLRNPGGEYMTYNLRAFEDWVASKLRLWLEQHKSNTDTCGKLGDLIQDYHDVAFPLYSGNPEATSIMLLTILEVWIACDESAIHICDFLRDYDPGMPQELFQSLALPFKCQMERLLRAEDYLNRRQRSAQFGSPSIFRDFGLPSCFAVRYFNQSPEHQDLLATIENRATLARHEKCEELRLKKEKYKSLIRLQDQSVCEYDEVIIDIYNDFRERRHSNSCHKCRYGHQAASLSIEIHEWPLPSNVLSAQSTVFELKVPCSFGCWRDTTVSLLLDVLKNEHLSTDVPRASHPLHSYQGLLHYFTPFSSKQRVGLLSQNKPHAVTHRRKKSIATTEEGDVCLSNRLQHRYYDGRMGVFVDNFHATDEIPKISTYQVPSESASLQQYLFRPAVTPSGPTPNTVIAGQSDCPDHMSLDEYRALSTIPLGYRIQWQNILLQLTAPSVD